VIEHGSAGDGHGDAADRDDAPVRYALELLSGQGQP
jgi:hypothetical protein